MSGQAADLWSHQPAAVAAVAAALRGGGRATVESACGTGKSRIGAAAAGVLAPGGRVLVTVPTLELAGQMLVTFAGYGGAGLGRAVAVCSDGEVVPAAELAELGLAGGEVAVTTDPARLAALTAVPGRVTVLCTYQSLAVLAAAHAGHGLPAWDLVIVDEAHRTAGRAGKAWALIHDDVVIPAARRLYMTATLKILGAGDDELAVSMDDPKVYGPVVFRFPASEGIRRGLLADYQLLVVVVTDADVLALAQADDQRLRVGGAAVGPRMLATQIAVLRAAREYGIRRAITYHHRVADARAWAELLPRAREMMPPGQRPAVVSADHVYGGQRAAERRQVLGRLRADAGDEAGALRVVCNARVLTEGVDAPAVDGIVLVDPRNSVIDTVQAVGRALRTGGKPGKIATIIVPVFTGPDEDPESALAGSAYAQVWQVIRALRATDDRLSTRMDSARTRLGERRLTPGSGTGQEEEPGGWLRVCGAAVPAGFAAAIALRAVQEASSSWMEYYGAARTHYQACGHLDLPVGYTAPGGMRLGEWLRNQRRFRSRLPADRVTMLDQIGMTWHSHASRSWQQGITAARDWAAAHDGSLRDIPSGTALSTWLARQRQDLRNGELPAPRRTELDAIDPAWHLTGDAIWDQHYQAARAHAAEHHHLRPAPGLRTPDGLDLPAWLDRQRINRRAGELQPGRRELLDAIGMPWSLPDDDWQQGLDAARAWAAAHGNLDVPAGLVTEDGFRLGAWLAGRRRSDQRGKLPAGPRRKALEDLDPGWQTTRSRADRWAANYQAAREYAAEHGRLPTGRGAARDPAPRGTDFRPWLREQRQLARRGQLTPGRLAALSDLDPGWRGTTQPGPPPAQRPPEPGPDHAKAQP